MKYLFFIITVVLYSCSDKGSENRQTGVMLLHKSSINTYTGQIVEYYSEADQRKFEEIYVNGLKSGTYRSWHKNKKMKVIGKYKQGKRVGIWKWFRENGDIEYAFRYGADKRT